MDSTEVPPSWLETDNIYKYLFYTSLPKSEHHATLPNVILNYPLVFKIGMLRQEFMPDALPDATLPISRLGTGSTNGSNNGRGWGFPLN
jgi:hypothetical protein